MTSVDRPSPPRLVGRAAELDRLRALVAPAPDESRVLVVLGEAGMGKTVLLADVAGSWTPTPRSGPQRSPPATR
jgi:ABC-type sulfate/molybdate transport systems ATPase subunit